MSGKFFAVLALAALVSPPLGAEEATLEQSLDGALSAYSKVNDYSCRFKKTEPSASSSLVTETLYLKFEKPFKIFLKALDTPKKGVEIVYERGRHNNRLAIHKPGLLFGLAPVLFLDQNSPWVREGSATFDIEDAGIGTFLVDFNDAVTRADSEGLLNVRPLGTRREGTVEGVKFDVTFDVPAETEVYFARRVEVLFDSSALPVWMALYGWDGQTIGIYAYENLKLNTGPEDAEFRKQIHRSLYRVWKTRRGSNADGRRATKTGD